MTSDYRRVATVAIVAALWASASIAVAHPGSGLLVEADGSIWITYGPSHRIWRVDASGAARPVVTGSFEPDHLRVPHHLVRYRDAVHAAGDDGIVWRIPRTGAPERVFPPPGVTARVGVGGEPFTIDAGGVIIGVAPDDDPASAPHVGLARFAPDGTITRLAGGHRGDRDGVGAEAQFANLHVASFALAADGALYLTDDGRRIRRVDRNGTVTTIAGGPDRATVDGTGAAARFEGASGLVVGPDGVILVADATAHRVRRVMPDGATTTVAGTGDRGGTDGPASEATFDGPVGVAFDARGDLIVLESPDHGATLRLRRVCASDGTVTTIAVIADP